MKNIFKISNMRVFKKASKIKDLRKSSFNRIVCSDTGEICFSYKQYLRSKHWRLFKKRYNESSIYTGMCKVCSATQKLHHHHLTYDRIGKEKLEDIVLLCKGCHRNVHSANRKGRSWEDIVKQLEDI